MNGLLRRSITALALVLCAGLLLLPSSASASRPHAVIPPFGSAGSGSGQFELAFNSGIAVNEATHDVYVADTGNHRVDEFDSSGNFIRAFGADVGGLGVDVCMIGCFAGTAGSTPGALETPTFIAVDNSAGGEGDVYVADTAANLVTKFKADGTLVSSWGVGGQLDGLSADQPFPGPFSELIGIAVDAAGNLDVLQRPEHVLFRFAPDSTFLTDFETPRGSTEMGLAIDPDGNFLKVNGEPSVQRFDSLGTSLGQVTSSLENTGLAVDAATGELYVDNRGESIDAYVFLPSGEVEGTGCTPSPEIEGCLPTETFAAGSLTAGGALATDGTSHTTYAVDWGAGKIVGFRLEILPQVETEAATEVDKDSAVLHGTVSAAGGQPASCEFQYTTREAFDSGEFAGATSVPCVPPGPFNGSTAEAVSAELNGLAPGTVYVFRVVAGNAEGTTNGPELEFLTAGPPAVSGESASEVSAHGARLNGLVDPKGSAANFSFQYVSGPQFDESGYAEATSVPLPAASVPAKVTGIGDISGIVVTADLVAGSTEMFNLKNLAGEELEFHELEFGQAVFGPGIPAGTTIVNPDGIFLLSQAATASAEGVTLSIGKFSVANVTATGGRFTVGQIVSGPGIPFNTKIKAVEPSRLLLSKLPTETTLGANLIASGPQSASQFSTGLAEDTLYHFRLVAGNSEGSVDGPDATLSTLPQAPPNLPDGRAYEMVSPPEKAGEVFAPEPIGNLGGSCAECLPGNQLAILPIQAAPDGESIVYSGQPFGEGLGSSQNQYLARRSPGGWSTQSLTPAVPRTGTHRMFSSNLARAVISQSTGVLSPEAPVNDDGIAYPNLYLREEGATSEPLVTQAPPNRIAEESAEQFKIQFAGANVGNSATELTHVVFEANDALTAAEGELAPAAPVIGAAERNLYEWQNGKLQLVNVLPGNASTALNGVIGSGHLLNAHPSVELAALDNAISDDGNRVFWTDTGTGKLYVREGGATTVEIPTAENCRSDLLVDLRTSCFLTASANGGRVLLSDGTLRNVDTPADPATDLTSGSGGFRGIMGANTNLSRIYFVDTAILTGGEENANQELAEIGALNLYAWSGGTTNFIGRLASNDQTIKSSYFPIGDFQVAAAGRTAQVSPDGSYLTFMSAARLTGYDNEAQGGGGCRLWSFGCYEIFVYEASSAKLICASCRHDLARPLGDSNLSLIKPVPGASTPRQPGNLSIGGSGRLFFESKDVLSSMDTNGSIQDVYEWEPNGVGDCRRVQGCVALISSGNSPVDSMFVDSTPSGDDAFFITRQQLLSEDADEQLDLYDARVGGGIESGGNPAPCGGEACKAPIAPAPTVPTPGSSSVSGAGNVKPVPKKKHHRKRRHKTKRHQANKHKANDNNGGSK